MSFESLKKEASQLERQLEEKVHRFQQLAQDGLSSAEQGTSEMKRYSSEIDMLFRSFQDFLTHKLRPAALTPTHRAAAQRYTEILKDLRIEYDNSSRNLRRHFERQELLAGSSAPSSGGDIGMDSLLRERNHINNSLNIAGSVIGQAEGVRSELHYQGRGLRNTNSLMGQMASQVPGLNNLIDSIRARRLHDDKVVAVVIASCIVFTLWYVFG